MMENLVRGLDEAKDERKKMEERLTVRIDTQEENWKGVREELTCVKKDADKMKDQIMEKEKDGAEKLEAEMKSIQQQRKDGEANLWSAVLLNQQGAAAQGAGRGGGGLAVAGRPGGEGSVATQEPRRGVDDQRRMDWKNKEEKMKQERVILEKARRTVGLGPIYKEHVEMEMKAGSGWRGELAANEEQAMWGAFKTMLRSLRLTNAEIDSMEMVRTFRPRRENSNIVYVELKERESVMKIYGVARYLLRGQTLCNHIPPEFHERYSAMERVCYEWRQERKERTRIRIGESGLEVWRKSGPTYNRVPEAELGKLPEVELNARRGGDAGEEREDPGPRPTIKRPREPSTPGRSPQAKILKNGELGDGDEMNEETPEEDEENQEEWNEVENVWQKVKAKKVEAAK
jgi:hypothetical protein